MSILPVKNILRRKGQSTMTALITAISIFTFVVILGVFETFQQGLALTDARLGADVMVLPNDGGAPIAYHTIFTGEPQNVYMEERVMESLAQIDGIAAMTPQFFTQTLDQSCCSVGAELRLVGYDSKTDFILAPWFEEQNLQGLTESQLIAGSGAPSFLGGTIMILGHPFQVAGTLYETGSGMDQTLFADIDLARQLAAQSEQLEQYWQGRDPSTLISSVMIKAEEGVSPEDLVQAIRDSGLDVTATATDTVIQSTRTQVFSIGKIVWLLWGVILLLSVLALWGRFYALARDRRREIGLLRALGCTPGRVFSLILSEALLLAAIGGVIGSLAGAFAAAPILSALQELLSLTSGAWSLGRAMLWAGLGVLLSLVLGAGAAFFPCRSNAALEPIAAIHRGGL